MHLKNQCPKCGHIWYTRGLSGIPMFLLGIIPWVIGVADIIQRLVK